jgi:N-acetylmuramoyl-L-alanine amidase
MPVTSPVLAPYRDPADFALCVAPESLAPLNITYLTDNRNGRVRLTGPNGDETTARLRTGPYGRSFIPLIEVIEALGGKCEWVPATNTVHVRAVLTSVDLLAGQLRVKTTLPVTATLTHNRNTNQVIVDLAGTERGALPRLLPLTAPNLLAARTGQFDSDTTRVVLDMKEPATFALLDAKPTTQLVLNPVPTKKLPSIVIKIPPDPPGIGTTPPAMKPRPAPPPPAVVNDVTFRRVSDGRAQIVISTRGTPSVRPATLNDLRLTLELANATLGDRVASTLEGARQHPLLRAVRVTAPRANAARLVIDLARVVAYTVSPGPGGLVVDLTLPRNAGGRLAGKLVVVDAGHGGSDSGALGVGGFREKNVTLAIASALRDKLQQAGANVIMTRSNDVFIPLDERPGIANRAGADFFIAVHADSAARNRSVNGSTVYYHMQIPSSRALALSIAERFEDMGAIRSKGIRSDSVIYPRSGFAVLRGARMVAVLVECGFMTNAGDMAQLVQTATQNRIAEAIAGGLRDYIEGNPRMDTRNINPAAGEEALEVTPDPFGPEPGGAEDLPSGSEDRSSYP